MKIYISPLHKHIIFGPNKCGSSTIEHMLQTRWDWDNVWIGKKITDPAKILDDYIEPASIINFRKILLVRNPFDYIISGFRHIQYENRRGGLFPDTLTDHLIAIKNFTITDQYWIDHCQYQPADFYNPGFIIHKLEEWDKFLQHMNFYCKKDYNSLEDYQVNKQMRVEYPDVNDFEKQLIIELTRKAAILTKYNIEESIDAYRKKYNSGELNELYNNDVHKRKYF